MALKRGRTNTSSRKPTPKPRSTPKAAAPQKDPAATKYADKAPTDLHKAYANWIVSEVGYRPDDAKNRREAFLMGVSISTAARPTFQASAWLEEWRAENGVTKVGRKAKDEEPADAEEYDDDEATDEEADDAVDLDELEEELQGLQIGKLRAAAKDYGVSLSQGMKKNDIIEAILAVVEAEGDEADDDGDDEEGDEELDLAALEEEMEGMDLPELKAFVEEEFDIKPKPRERKGPLIQRVLDALEEEESSEGDDEEDDADEEDDTPPAKSNVRQGARAGSKTGKKADDFLF